MQKNVLLLKALDYVATKDTYLVVARSEFVHHPPFVLFRQSRVRRRVSARMTRRTGVRRPDEPVTMSGENNNKVRTARTGDA